MMTATNLAYTHIERLSDNIINDLIENNVDISKPQKLCFFVLFPDLEGAQACSNRLAAAGYLCDVEEPHFLCDEYQCTAVKKLQVSAIGLAEPERLLNQLQVEYDGCLEAWSLVEHEPVDEQVVQELAQSILQSVQVGDCDENTYVATNPANFSDVDLKFYLSTQQALESLGYRYLGDIEDTRLEQAHGIETFIRNMVHPSNHSMVSFYYLNEIHAGFVDLTSLLGSGQFVIHTTAPKQAEITHYPHISAFYVSGETAIAQLVLQHQGVVESKGGDVVEIDSLASLIEVCTSMEQMKYEHLKRIGWVTLDYLKTQTGDNDLAEAIYRKVLQINKSGQPDFH